MLGESIPTRPRAVVDRRRGSQAGLGRREVYVLSRALKTLKVELNYIE